MSHLRVLMDYHHHDLWESMELLAQRLGWDLYRPIGMDWYEQGYWNHERKWHGDAIARQYLTPWGSDYHLHGFDAEGKRTERAGRFTRYDRSHQRFQNLVTLEAARSEHWDIVLSSLAHNHEGFARFASEVGATFGLQIGNVRFSETDMAEDRWDLAAFGLVSGLMPVTPPKPHVVYHQEFSVHDSIIADRPGFTYVPPPRGERFRISSFVQCYPETEWAYAWMTDSAAASRELDWRVYGAYGQAPADEYAAGNIDECHEVARAMRASDVAWHAKRWSDGYGHVIHNWFAVGRPVFGFEAYYRDQLAGALWVDGVTSINIESRNRDEIVRLLRHLRDDEDAHLRMCEAAAARFREIVNFDAEAEQIRAMLSAVLP